MKNFSFKKLFFINRFPGRKKIWEFGLLLLLSILLVCWLLWGNTAPERDSIQIISSRLPTSFDGFTIVQISDLHNTEFGESNKKLLEMIGEASPDIIVLTGDLIDSPGGAGFCKEGCKACPDFLCDRKS